MLLSRRLVPLVIVLLALRAQARAQPPLAACADAYEQTQRLRKSGKLLAARAQAIVCAQASCPVALRKDCVDWLRDIDAATPSIVIDVRDADGAAVTPVRTTLDGAVIDNAAIGRALPVDPGRHTVRGMAADGRSSEAEVMVVEAASRQPVRLTLAAAVRRVTPPRDPPGRPSPLLWTLGATAVTGTIVAAFFGVRGLERRSDARDECAPACPPSRRDPIERDFLIADAAGAVALLAGGAATWLWWRSGERGGMTAVVGPGHLVLRGRF